MGRHSLFTPELAQEIGDRIAQGQPLAHICRDEHMPAVRTVNDWQDERPDFAASIAHARVVGHDLIAANTRLVAKGEEGYSSGDVQRDKLMVDTDLKLLAKWDPKRYGDRTVLAGDPAAPLVHEVTTDLERAKAVAALVAAAQKGKD